MSVQHDHNRPKRSDGQACNGTRKSGPSLSTIYVALMVALAQINALYSFSPSHENNIHVHQVQPRTTIQYPQQKNQWLFSTFTRSNSRQKLTWKRGRSVLLFDTTSCFDHSEDDLERLSRIHKVITKLQRQIPTLLTTPLTETSSKAVYDDKVQLLVQDQILCSSRDELVSLSTTLVLAVVATNQANSFLASAVSSWGQPPRADDSSSQQQQPSKDDATLLQSKMAIDPTLQAVRVQWQVTLPSATTSSPISSSNPRQLKGISDLTLDPNTGKVTELKLLEVQWNNERLLNARAIGESLASLRQLVFAVQNSPVVKTFLPKSTVASPYSTLSNLLGVDFMQQMTGQAVPSSRTKSQSNSRENVTPLFVVDSLESAFVHDSSSRPTSKQKNTTVLFHNTHNNTTTNSSATTTGSAPSSTIRGEVVMIPIDEYNTKNASALPLPGSNIWSQYVAARRIFQNFLQDTLPVLSGNKTIASREMVALFSNQANLIAADGSVLLRGKDQIGIYFHTLASWRKRSLGTWHLTNATLLSWRRPTKHHDHDEKNANISNESTVTISVSYRSTSSLPGSSSPVVIQGTDHFLLESAILLNTVDSSSSGSEQVPGDDDDDEDDDVDIVIKRIEQKKLVIGGVGGRSTNADGLWFMKSLVGALDAGKFSSVGGDSVMMDLLQRVIAGESGSSLSSSSINGGEVTTKKKSKKGRRLVPPKLPESIAARVYFMMAGLHEEIPLLVDRENLRIYQVPPLHEYMSENVELRGYLGETFSRGLASYNRAVGTSFASLRGALATGSVKMEQDPSVAVELTAEGNIRLSLTVDLKVLPLPSVTSDLISSMSGSAIKLPSGGFPLELAVVSDYVVDRETGDIYQHRLVETRINAQLTPGDVISRWIRKQTGTSSEGGTPLNSEANGVAFQQSLFDAIAWVRSMNKRV